MGLTLFDIIALALLGISALVGFVRGAFYESGDWSDLIQSETTLLTLS